MTDDLDQPPVHAPGQGPSARVDSWLWAVRVYKTRSAATTACRAGHVRVNGEKAKAAQPVRPGDELRVRISGFDRILVVKQAITKRVGAPLAAAAVDDRTPPPPPRELTAFVPVRDRGAGRPTKRERRDIDRLRGRDDLDD
ncbi:RNA-binding S4 domain-containing protein [Microbacterium sp. CFBP9034]|uniref:RNA-binding S4 domain-containing protein n=1 Tax=Microbacterium sp. CFBP9034 TaxID=3096540 RepID=UPI002A69A5C9|nr:S4 domain-containing protein [Microbacterium sp. CFBP9034]MDY0910061.1 S4 domain-containing protein [Microbacterium sp. CFBP9034]